METVVQGLQRRFLHTLTHHHTSNKFDTVSQGTKTIQEVLNDLKKYATWMIHPPDVYMFHKWFVSALRDLLHNEVLCIPKKNGKLCTVFNLQEQNDNMVKDVTPFPDQDIICNDMARAAYQSKLDMSEAYKQICIV